MLTSFLAKSYMFLRKPVRFNHSAATAGIQHKEQNKATSNSVFKILKNDMFV